MSYGEFPDIPNDSISGAVVALRRHPQPRPEEIHEVNLKDPGRSRSSSPTAGTYADERQVGLHPFDGETEAKFELATTPRAENRLSRNSTSRPSIPGSSRRAGKATRSKSVRWHAVSCLATGNIRDERAGRQHAEGARRACHGAVLHAWSDRRARARDAGGRRTRCSYLYDPLIDNIRAGDLRTHNATSGSHRPGLKPRAWPRLEAPRGGLGHWMVIEDRRSPTTRRGAEHLERRAARRQGPIGPYEARCSTRRWRTRSAARDPAHDPQLRPLPGCATHVMSPEAKRSFP